MGNYTVDASKKWEYENGFYLTCETSRIGKFLNHLEIYKQIVNLPGDVLEFGVYKGASLMRLLAFRELLENTHSRKVIGFDAFGKFPVAASSVEDKQYIEKFESIGGEGISEEDLSSLIDAKGISNYELIQGDILETLPAYIEKRPALKVSLLHIDVDVYKPAKVVLELLWDRVVKGGILMLDDYATVEGETRAVDEFFADKNIQLVKNSHYKIPVYAVKP